MIGKDCCCCTRRLQHRSQASLPQPFLAHTASSSARSRRRFYGQARGRASRGACRPGEGYGKVPRWHHVFSSCRAHATLHLGRTCPQSSCQQFGGRVPLPSGRLVRKRWHSCRPYNRDLPFGAVGKAPAPAVARGCGHRAARSNRASGSSALAASVIPNSIGGGEFSRPAVHHHPSRCRRHVSYLLAE